VDDTREALSRPACLNAKIVIRCADFERSCAFYAGLLGLHPVEEWTEAQGRGCIFALRENGPGCLEIYEMSRADSRYVEAFTRAVANDKIDVQLRVESVDAWVVALRGKWEFVGPVRLPWGQRWLKLRDPDGVLIALYEEG
jgi:catechol 2,3-dioxygenase-like lactoylglutathione lyase family enzyme